MRQYSARIYEAVAAADRTQPGVQLGCACIDAQVPVQVVAKWFGVSRQAIYDWFTGNTGVRQKHEARIESIVKVLNRAVDAGALPAATLAETMMAIKQYKEVIKNESPQN